MILNKLLLIIFCFVLIGCETIDNFRDYAFRKTQEWNKTTGEQVAIFEDGKLIFRSSCGYVAKATQHFGYVTVKVYGRTGFCGEPSEQNRILLHGYTNTTIKTERCTF